ncbi:MAG TPA: YIP1 family protein [Casimicrobiaceae bacterium]|nr:YIP1 family protein [Casimicrobiaceae bacterium]
MFCAQCGKPVLDAARLCNHCGAPVPSARPAPDSGLVDAPSGSGPAAAGSEQPPGGETGLMTGGLIRRVRNIVLSPATEWPVIAAEPSSPATLYLRYVAPLVAIGAIATFIGHSVVGLPLVGRVGVAASLVHAVFAYALSFLGVFLIAVIVDLLAPSFEGKRDALAALKVTVYSFTPGWVAAIFSIVPVLGVLAILGALYGLYLLYLGLPVLMRCPHEKSVGYTFVTVLCAIVTWIVIAALSTCAVGGLGLIGVGVLSRMGR